MKNPTTLILSILISASGLWAQDDPYAARREKVFDIIDQDIAIIKNSGRDYVMEREVNWNYYYLTGDVTEGAILVMSGKDKSARIFRSETGYGKRDSLINGLEYKNTDEQKSYFNQIPVIANTLWIDFSAMINLEDFGNRMQMLRDIKNIGPKISEMRPIKDEHEMKLLNHAINATAEGLVEVMKAAEPGMNEKDFELILKYRFEKAGCEHLGFGIQAASGPNSTFVHYGANDRQTEKGDMMVFDVGARYGYYSADISRSFPVSGKFTKEQKEIYSLVLKAQKAAITELKPGVNISAASRTATDVLNNGLAELGLITDVNSKWQQRFWIQHGFFHNIGLVVHDVGGYKGELLPGMILTMEPGLYFPADYLENIQGYRFRNIDKNELDSFIKAVKPIFEKYINIGVRIEDDVYITEDGNKVISVGVPKEIEEIEELMKNISMFNR